MFAFSDQITAASASPDPSEVECADDLKDYHVASLDTDLDQLKAVREQIELMDAKIAVLAGERFGLQKCCKDAKLIRFYTGFQNYTVCHAVYLALEPTADTMIVWTQIRRRRGDLSNSIRIKALEVEKLPHIDQFFMFLWFVWQGFRE